ncbi:MAG TPA: hypothetical protein VGJ26_05830 [Pirellulales bacterium]|jgi:hypothetical protein
MANAPRKISAKKPHIKVSLVIHCEYFQMNEAPCKHPRIDEMVFHVAGSLRTVQSYVRKSWTSPHGWWKVEQRLVDETDHDADDRPVTHYFNYRGTPCKNLPHASARRAFDKWQEQVVAEIQAAKDKYSQETP